MKKSVTIMLLMSLLFTMFASVGHAAAPPPKLFLDGNQLVSDVPPVIENGSTLVPLAILSEGLGYEVEWEQSIRKVTVKKDSTVIELIIGEAMMKVNDVIMETPIEPKLIQDRTMVPVRLVGELLGLSFEWDGVERSVLIYSKPEEPAKPEELTEPAEPVNPETPVAQPDGTTDPNSEQPLPNGYITGIAMDEHSVITITHTDVQKPNAPLLLVEPKRLVFDFQNTTFLPPTKGETVVSITDNPLLTQYKYAQFSAEPLIARLVIQIGDDTGYVLSESEGAFHIALMPASEVPVPETPGDQTEVYDVVIDAGHGDTDPGALSKSMNRWEKEFNLSVALLLKAELEKDKRIRVHMTRSDDTFLELADRIEFAEDLKADLFLSIHANSFDNTSVNGSETYYYRDNSKPLADLLHKYVVKGSGLNDRGVRKAAFKVIKETTMPAVLLESGYLSNSGDAKALFDKNVQARFAAEVANGIKDYLKLK